jgi:diamine N-acetyltransferase
MISFLKVTKKNVWDIIKLQPGKTNEKHIASNSDTVIEATFDNRLEHVKAIYYDKKLLGLTYFYPFNGAIWICRFMIDEKYQGKGHGTKIFEHLIKHIKNKYSPTRIELSTDNPIAIKLFKKHEFVMMDNNRSKAFFKEYKEHIMILKIIN